jgi:Taurine catabolism dioxygenase TauD, TfdA family
MSQVRNPVTEPPYVILSADKTGDSLLSVDASLVRALYMEHGALLFRGFAWDVEVFRAVTDRFCSNYVWNDSGGRKIITADRRIQTVNLGVAPFPLHPELARLPWRPDVAWFACVVAPREGGETLVCDGIRIVDALPDGLRRELGHRRLLYKREMGPGELEFWFGLAAPNDEMLARPRAGCPFKYSREAGKIFGSFTYPVLHKPMFSEKRAFANFLLFARFAEHRLDAKSQQMLRSALADTERLLSQGGAPPAGGGAPHRLESLAVGFETDHPTLAASVRQFIALLGEAGL